MDPNMLAGWDQMVAMALGGGGGAMPGMPKSLMPNPMQGPGAGMDFTKMLGGLGPLAMNLMKGGQPQPNMPPQFANLQGPGGNFGQAPAGMPAGPLAMANAIKQRSPY